MEKKKYYWRKAKIDWAYIAGFFDGEGTFILTDKTEEIATSQSLSNSAPIYAISKFLFKKKIYHSLIEEKETRNPNWENQAQIRIRRFGPMKKFLTNVIPYLKLKREKAIKMYSFLYNKKGRSRETRKKLNELFYE